MKEKSLEDLLKAAGNPVNMLRNSQIGAYVYPVVPSEYTNWRDEQRAWRETAVLFDQSHHMANVYVEGPDALKMLSYLGTNSFAKFPVNRAKQFSPCSYDGYVIGDGILFHLEESRLVFVGRAPVANWIQFHAETGGYNLKIEKDDSSPSNPKGKAVVRSCYRFQIQGPNAPPDPGEVEWRPASRDQIFQHGSHQCRWTQGAGASPWHGGCSRIGNLGTYEEREEIREAVVAAGKDFGLSEVGARAYATNTLESGWIPSPLPAVYTGEQMKAYRQWLPAASYEATGSIGGSFESDNIEDYYMSPYDLGYGPFVKFDHDFIGREALEKMQAEPQRKKVTFAWDSEDVLKAFASMFEVGEMYKYIDLPLSNYASSSYDKVVHAGKNSGFLDVQWL